MRAEKVGALARFHHEPSTGREWPPQWRRGRWLRVAVLVLVSAVAGGSLGSCTSGGQRPEVAVAVVNGHRLRGATFDSRLRTELRLRSELTIDALPLVQLANEVRDRMIDDELIRGELDRRGVTVDEQVLSARLNEWRARFRTSAEFDEYVADRYGALDAFRAELRRSTARARLMEMVCPPPAIDDATVRAYYDGHTEEFTATIATPMAPLVRPFEDAAPEIRESLQRQRQLSDWRRYTETLRKPAKIERLSLPAHATAEVQP